MFEGAVAGILNRLLGKYVQDLDTENLNVGIFSGNVNLADLKLKPEALYELDLPIDVKIGTIGKVNLQIPWSGLYTQPVVVHIEDVLILVGPAISNSHFDPERERRLTRAAKRKILQDLEAESEVLKGPQNFFENLFTAIVNNLQIYVRNVHVRYEDSISSKDGPLACGLCLQSLSIETTNGKWKASVTPANASTVYQMMRIESLSLYWNPTATALDDAEVAHITPMQYYNWKHYMLTGLDKFSMHHEDFEFLLKPVTCKVKVIINRSGEARVPRLLLDAVLQDSALQLSRRQYLSVHNLLMSFQRITLHRKYRHLHPGVPLTKNIKLWWKYAYNVVVEQRVRPYTWEAIKKHRENYNAYKKTYKSTLRSPNDIELKLDLQKCEDSLPIISVVIAREHAKFELLSQEPERIEVVETEFDWWRPDSESEGEGMELCVKTERGRSLWSHLSSPERRRVCELIGYADGARDRSKQYIEHKLNLTLANCTLTLMNRSKEVMVVNLTQFLVSLETRPSAKAYKVSARTESIVIEGMSDGDLVPLLLAAQGSLGSTVLALDVEKNPANSHADLGVTCHVEPIELIYVEHAFTELINFFQTHSMTSEELSEQVSCAVEHVTQASKAVLAHAVSRRHVLHLNVDIKGPVIVLPEHGCVTKEGRVLVVDISRVLVKSELQPPEPALEDATCMELEERLYDRFHAECVLQLLLCEASSWREERRVSTSAQVVPRLRALLVFSTSIKKEYRLLPRYKLNISLSSLKFNLSDRIIGYLLDFFDNFPIPVPNTVPVSFMDSGDYVEEPMDPELLKVLEQDRVTADPGYTDLVKLRQKIVAAYFSRNRAESKTDGDSTKSPADESVPLAEISDEDVEEFARSVDLPGFDDNVSPSNTIDTLMRFIIGEIVINLNRSSELTDKPYLMLVVSAVCADAALMRYGPALQLSLASVLLADKQHCTSNGQYLELLTSSGELFNLLYRKVRANCPEFRSHFHNVEQALVADTGPLNICVHAPALTAMCNYLQYVSRKIQKRHSVNIQNLILPKTTTLWDYMMKPEADPPVPPGATKFSYSMRVSSVTARLCQAENALVEARVTALESDCAFRANDRLIFKLFLGSLQVDDLAEATLYPKLVWPDEDKVLELKYVRCAAAARSRHDAELRVRVGRLHAVLLCSLLCQLQQFLEPLIPSAAAGEAAAAAERAAQERARALRAAPVKVNLAIEIHAPVLLMPQKSSSPNLLVLNMGDLLIENFFKSVNSSMEASSPIQSPVIDNVLIKLVNITLSRAVMTLAGTLEVQEPILEPITIRCDLKHAVSYVQNNSAYRELLLCDAGVLMDCVTINLGQKDLATVLAVWSDNLSEGHYIGSIIPSSPVELAPSEATVKKLQAFFAQGDPVKKESVFRFSLEGIELKLFSDMDEILSSPVRDLNHGLAKLTAGEANLHVDYFSDGSVEAKASLQSLLIEDIRQDSTVVIRRILESQGGGKVAGSGFSVSRPALVECGVRRSARASTLDARVERTRLNLALPFLLRLARTLLDAMPAVKRMSEFFDLRPITLSGEKLLEGGVINHGYVGDALRSRARPASTDSTSGYFSTGTSVSEDMPSLSISIQCRQPEVMFFTDLTKTEGHALLLRTELLIDYSSHSNTESLVVSLAGLQVMSKLQSKLKNLAPQLVLKPCDLEFSQSFKNVEEGVMVKLSVSEVDVHIAPTTVHTIIDIVDEISTELTIPEEKEVFNFATYNPRPEKQDEDLWAPKKLTPYVGYSENSYVQPTYPTIKPTETFMLNVPIVRITFEIEHTVRVPVLLVKLSLEATAHEWSRTLHGGGSLRMLARCYNERTGVWEPLLEPEVLDNVLRPWEINATVFQAKSYSMSSRMETKNQEETMSDNVTTEIVKKPKKKNAFESETSADEADTENEMVFIKNPSGKENKGYNVDYNADSLNFLKRLDYEDSDSDNEKDKLNNAMGLFTDSDSSMDGMSNDADSSGPEQSEVEGSDREEAEEMPVSYIDGEGEEKKKGDIKIVTVQEPEREDSLDSSSEDHLCTYIRLEARSLLDVTLAPAAVRALQTLSTAICDRTAAVTAIVAGESGLQLINDIGPGSSVSLRTHSQTDLAGNDCVLAVADYDSCSRSSTPECDTSGADLLEDEQQKKQEVTDISDEWDCFEGGFGASAPTGSERQSPGAPPSAEELRRRITDLTLSVKLHDFDQLNSEEGWKSGGDSKQKGDTIYSHNRQIVCPQRSVSKLHVLHPSRNNTRYYVVVERSASYNHKKIVVRSPLQVRNETSYPLELLYRQSELEAAGAEAVGAVRNPFCGLVRLAVLAPQDTYNVPLYIAYHCRLYLLPSSTESYQASTQGLWWMELMKEMGITRDVVCPAIVDEESGVFAMRVLPVEGCKSNKVSRSIPNLLLRILPPLALHNRLPYALQISGGIALRVEAGERVHLYTLPPSGSHKISLEMQYLGLPWSGSFTLSPDMAEKTISMTTDVETEGGNKRLCVRARHEGGGGGGEGATGGRRVLLYAPEWIINKTGLPLQIKGQSDACYEPTEEPLLWCERGRLRVRAHQSRWSRAARPLADAPGLLVCAHAERRRHYRMLLHVTLSELCPQLTKLVTLLPYFMVFNDTRRPLRFMEENEAADLWLDLTPQQCIPFWPQTDSMAMHVKYRDSTTVSQHFSIVKNHFTVLRMDKGTAICVDVTGGTDRPFTVTFRPYGAGDAPVRIDNLCDDLFLKLHQTDSGQVALLSPYQSMLYTWDDPVKERGLLWNIYNNKGKGFLADFSQDGFGEVKVSFHSVKHSTLVATNSYTSKLSSTLKRLTPKSPEPGSSSSGDSDSSEFTEIQTKSKKMRKDKVIVYWISFMDGYQRVFALAQDEKIALQYKKRINFELCNYEMCVSLANVGLSVCVQTGDGVKELSYISCTDSLPRWEVNVGNKWKQLASDVTAWVEEKYQTEQKKCQLKDYLHIDLEKMQMTKPFFSELRRTYNPGVWLHFRKSDTFTYCHLKLQRLQIDNQLHEAVFPCVFYPMPLPSHLRSRDSKPSVEIVSLKQYRPSLNQDIYKYFKVLVQEYCVNLDRGFVNHVFDILNYWKVEEKPAVRLRADLALVHMPLPVIAMRSQTSAAKDVIFEFAHLSPLKIVLSLSSRGYLNENADSPTQSSYYGLKENRPKLFNSDLLEFLFNSWGSSLCDMKDVVIRMSYLELHNTPITLPGLLDAATRHYRLQLVQQFYVLVLGLNILGNPYSYIGDFSKGLKEFYEPCMGLARKCVTSWLFSPARLADVEALKTRVKRRSGEYSLLAMKNFDKTKHTIEKELLIWWKDQSPPGEELEIVDNLPEAVIEANKNNPASVALALTGLIARPNFDEDCVIVKHVCREAARGGRGETRGGRGAAEALRASLQRANGSRIARRRLPRHCSAVEGLRPYSEWSARGAALLRQLCRGQPDGEEPVAHAHLADAPACTTLLVTTQNIYMATARGGRGWRTAWSARLHDVLAARALPGRLVLSVRQDEATNYYSSDEKVIEIPDPEVLQWLHGKIECALVYALEDKRQE